ncbi:MAG: hypothetical protein J0G30_12005 [Actinomycetales bacterium]|nr:hypothetical protein [Actinomycetales bacterium]
MEVEGRMPFAAGDVERALIVDTLRLEADHRSWGADPDLGDLAELTAELNHGYITEPDHDRVLAREDRWRADVFQQAGLFGQLADDIERAGRVEVSAGELQMIAEALEDRYGAAEPKAQPPVMHRVAAARRDLDHARLAAALQARGRELRDPISPQLDTRSTDPPSRAEPSVGL